MLLSEFLGKRVIVLDNASELGTIVGAYVHKYTYARSHLVLDNGKQIKIDDVFSLDEVVTILTQSNETIPLEEYHEITVNQEVILVSGKRLGKVKDIALNGKKKDNVLIADKGNVKLKSLVSCSNNIIIANPTYRILKARVKEPLGGVLALNGKQEDSAVNSVEKEFFTPTTTPSYDFLIGKKVNSEVSDINRSFVLMAGTIITEKVISNAIRAGKLTDLVNKSR